MTPNTKRLLAQVETWPEEDQEELAACAREIEARRSGVYHATSEELRAIDEGIAELDRGEVASEAEVRAAFAKFRSA
jgi:predicted transcriptional regulator